MLKPTDTKYFQDLIQAPDDYMAYKALVEQVHKRLLYDWDGRPMRFDLPAFPPNSKVALVMSLKAEGWEVFIISLTPFCIVIS